MSSPDLILNGAQRLLQADCKDTQQKLVKVLLVDLWKLLPVEDRQQFKVRVEESYPYDFIDFEKRFPDLNDTYLEVVARHWGYIMPTLEGDNLGFAKSFEKLIRFRKSPSEKQAAYAKSLYAEWKKYRYDEQPQAAVFENDNIEVME